MSLFPLDRAKSSEITRLTLEPLGSEKGEREGERRGGGEDFSRPRVTVSRWYQSVPHHWHGIQTGFAYTAPSTFQSSSKGTRCRRPFEEKDRASRGTIRSPLTPLRGFVLTRANRISFDRQCSRISPSLELGIRTSPNYLDSSRTRYSRYNWCSLCPRFVFVAISRWMDEKYDELLERINWLTMIERFIDIFFFRPPQSV